MPGISVQAEVVTYNFDDGTLQGWSNYEGVTEEFVVWNQDDGRIQWEPARSGNYLVKEADFGDRDSDTSVKILTSPVFWISATTSVEIWTLGGTGAVETPTWTNYSNLPVVAGNDFMGAALRRMSDGEYLLFSRRSSAGEGSSAYQSIGWDAPTIAAAVAGDSSSQQYVVDIIDTFTGGWGWITVDDITLTDVALVGDYPIAREPNPDKMATDVPRDVVLSWTPGEFADKHDVYFGASFDDVNNADKSDPRGVLASEGQIATTYDPPGRLEFDQTYYWRIDEVNAPPDSSIFKGEIWSFTVESLAYPIPSESIIATASSQASDNEGPEKTIDGSGMDENDLHSIVPDTMWISTGGDPGSAWIQYQFDKPYKLHEMFVWNYNGSTILSFYGLKDVTIEFSTDASSWTPLDNVPEFAQASGGDGYASDIVVPFDGAAAKYVRITGNSNWGSGAGLFNQYGLSEVRFFSTPVFAREPSPDSGATDVGVEASLSWRAGREADKHDVYLSTDEQAVIDGTALVATVTDASYSTSLDVDSTYYWRVDEVNDTENPTTWQGDIWSFSTQEYLVVDDFESYNDIAAGEEGSNLVYETWIDGFANPSVNGATMGYTVAFQPSLETSLVYDGDQSAPLFYDNTTVGYSEITANVADLQGGQDWAKYGTKGLTLRFYGDPDNAPQQMYVKVNGSKVTYDGDAENVRVAAWQMWYIDLASLGVSLSNVTELAIGFDRLGGVGGQGTILIDAVRLVAAPTMVPITVLDAGFDDHVLNNPGDWIYIGDSGYTGAWKSLFPSDGAWLDYNYYASDGDLPARSGNNKVYGTYTADDYIYQILDQTFVEGVTYTLSVWVGIAWSGYDDNWSLYFTGEDHANNLSETSGSAPVGSWGQVSLVYTATAADAGKKIGIKMYGNEYVTFEDVTLLRSAPAVTRQPDPADNLTVNPSFESPDLGPGGTGQWADYVDNWIINSQGSCYLEDGSWEIVAPDGAATLKMWSGAAIWQQIGNVSPNTDYEISMFIGRGYDTSAVQVELWAGGEPSALPSSYGVIGDTVGATLIGGASLTPTIKVGQSELMGLSLNTGADFGSEDALWIRIESIGGGGTAVWVDNVMVTIP